MKTKEEIIRALRGSKIVMINTGNPRNAEYIQHAINYIESMPKIHEELSTLNPMKIDEERLVRAWKTTPSIKEAIKYYNSTCKDHQVLQPLPKDIPAKIGRMICEYASDNNMSIDDIWKEIFDHYGTPTKKELVSVDELSRSIYNNSNTLNMNECTLVAQNLVNTYSLNPPKRDEFPFNLKRGEIFKIEGGTRVLDSISLNATDGVSFPLSECSHYVKPSIHDKVKEKLGIELYEEFMKEVKNG